MSVIADDICLCANNLFCTMQCKREQMRETKERKIMKCLLCMPKKTMGMQVALARGERDRSDAQDLSGVTVKICF